MSPDLRRGSSKTFQTKTAFSPQHVVEQLQNHIHLLPPYARNLVEILSVAGLRAEDAGHLPEDCLDYDATGDPRLRWYNHKMKRDGRPLPMTTAVAEAIERQRDLVREVPDLFGKRYLFRTKRGLYQFKLVCKHFNQLAERVPILGRSIASSRTSSGIQSAH